MTPVIELEGLSKSYRIRHQAEARYGALRDDLAALPTLPVRLVRQRRRRNTIEEFWALRDVSFDVQEGEVVGVVGRNGSGKSTLLKILSRITNPTRGEAVLHGRVASLLEVGTGFHPELTGRENIYFNGSVLGMRRREIERKFDEIVAFAETEQFLDTPVKFYSSGMYVRLAFAVAAHLEPDILLVDEVLAVGDAQFQRKCLGRMQDVSREGRTVLFVSHNMGSVRQLCTRGVLLDHGHATLYETSSELVVAYATNIGSDRSREVEISGGGIFFNSFRVNGNPPAEDMRVPQGEPLRVTFHYRTEVPPKRLIVGLGIKVAATEEFPVFAHNELENAFHTTGSAGLVETEIALPPLSPRRYRLELFAYLDRETICDAQPITEFEIVPEPSFTSGQVHTSFPALVLVDSTWRFETE